MKSNLAPLVGQVQNSGLDKNSKRISGIATRIKTEKPGVPELFCSGPG